MDFSHFKHGSGPVTDDKRDFQHSEIFGATGSMLKSLPQRLGRKPIKIKDQKDTNFCTAFSTSTASEFQEGIEFSPEFQAAKIGEKSGRTIVDGADPRMALEAARIFGSAPQDKVEWSLANKTPDFLANWDNWPQPLDLLAYPFEKQSYFRIDTGPFDPFDNIKLALSQAFGDNGIGIAFTLWKGDNWNYAPGGFVDSFAGEIGGFHAYNYLDFDETYKKTEVLTVQNSVGTEYGDQGLQHFTRDVVNAIYNNPLGSAAYIFRDLSPDVVRRLNTPFMGPLLRYLRRYFPNIVI